MTNTKKILRPGTPVTITREVGVHEEGCPKFPAGTQGLIVDQYELAPGIYEEDTYVVVIEGAGGVLMLAEGVEFKVAKKINKMTVLPKDVKLGDVMDTAAHLSTFAVSETRCVTSWNGVSYTFVGMDDAGASRYRVVDEDFKLIVEREVQW